MTNAICCIEDSEPLPSQEPDADPHPLFFAPDAWITTLDSNGEARTHPTFSGAIPGYVFTTRSPLGTGYYLDPSV